jgi:hypothetical protein
LCVVGRHGRNWELSQHPVYRDHGKPKVQVTDHVLVGPGGRAQDEAVDLPIHQRSDQRLLAQNILVGVAEDDVPALRGCGLLDALDQRGEEGILDM